MALNFGRSFGRQQPRKGLREPEFMFGSEPILAYRIWSVETLANSVDGWGEFISAMADAHERETANPYREMMRPRLGAVGYGNMRWPTLKPMSAKCDSDCEKVPAHDHECGVWALREPVHLHQALLEYGRKGRAFGTVHLWGRYIEFEKGYRAALAYPAEVTLIDGDPKTAALLSADYGIPVSVGPMPDAVEHLKKKRDENKEEMSPLNSWNLFSNFAASSVGTTITWCEDSLWPTSIVKPGEFWAEIQKRAGA